MLRREVVSSIVDEELLVQQAMRDTTIQVTDQEIADGVEQQVRQVRVNFTSEVDYKNELKKAGFQTPEEYRRWLTDQQRRAALQNRLIDGLQGAGKLKPVAPTEQEMRALLRGQQGQPRLPPGDDLVPADRDRAEADAGGQGPGQAQADSIVLELRRGADFATAAKRFSQDPGSREQGGSLNWFRRGVMVPEFERVAFSLSPGMISDPVESPFGFHIIQVERTQPAEVQARHILLTPEIDSANVDRARALAGRLHQLVSRGASIDSLQRIYHDPSGGEREAENVPADKLPEAYAGPIAKADSGTVVPVFVIKGPGDRDQYVVLQVTDRRSQGDIRYEDVKDRIRRAAGTGARDPPLHRPAAEVDLRGAAHLSGRTGDRRAAGQRGRCPASLSPSAILAASDRRSRPGRSSTPLDAEVTLVGAEDQIASLPAARRVPVGAWGQGSGEPPEDRARAIRAGRLTGHAVETAVQPRARGRGGCRSSPRRRRSTRCTSPAFPIPVTPSGSPISPAMWTWR